MDPVKLNRNMYYILEGNLGSAHFWSFTIFYFYLSILPRHSYLYFSTPLTFKTEHFEPLVLKWIKIIFICDIFFRPSLLLFHESQILNLETCLNTSLIHCRSSFRKTQNLPALPQNSENRGATAQSSANQNQNAPPTSLPKPWAPPAIWQPMLSYITTSRQASIQVGRRQRRDSQGTGPLMGSPHVATHDRTCAGNPPVRSWLTHGWNESAGGQWGLRGEFHTSCQLSSELSRTTLSNALIKEKKTKNWNVT